MAAEKDSYTRELSRAIDAAYANHQLEEPNAQEVLYQAFLDQANNVVFFRLRRKDDHLGKDIVHRAMLALPKFQGKSKLSTWFYRIAQNEVNRTLSHEIEARKVSIPIDGSRSYSSDDASDPPTLRDEAEQRARAKSNAQNAKLDVAKLQKNLPDRQAEVIALIRKGYTVEEIAEEMGEPLGTTRGRYRLAKKKMKAQAQAKENSDEW